MSKHHRFHYESSEATGTHHHTKFEHPSFSQTHGSKLHEHERIKSIHSAAHILKGSNGADLTITGAGDNEPFHSPRAGVRLASGDIAARYESNNDPSAVNRDPNRRAGHDYGAWQFNSRAKVPQEYVKWAQTNDPEVYAVLKDHMKSIGRGAQGSFGHAWREHAAKDPDSFNESQRRFAMDKYLRPLEERFPRLAQNQALQEQAFATAIQSGVGGATRLLKRAGFDRDDRPSQDLIADLTQVRSKAYRGNAKRYASEGRELDELSQHVHSQRIDKSAFKDLV